MYIVLKGFSKNQSKNFISSTLCLVLKVKGREFESVEERENHFPPLIVPMFKPFRPGMNSQLKGIDYTVC